MPIYAEWLGAAGDGTRYRGEIFCSKCQKTIYRFVGSRLGTRKYHGIDFVCTSCQSGGDLRVYREWMGAVGNGVMYRCTLACPRCGHHIGYFCGSELSAREFSWIQCSCTKCQNK